ncbi:MAG: F0F1 ATP synthase subunit alpha, partial [Actinobacteria bacterium]|nr:F0F1 ATP synthase subunit alpha [Actinomycetota bacterium]
MAQTEELKISSEEIAAALKRNIGDWQPSTKREEVGRVRDVGDGIARISGLPGAMANEMLEFPGGLVGLAMNLEEDEIGAVLLGEASHIEEGQPVKQTGQILSVGVGDALLGRVVNALGQPIDAKGPIETDERRPLEVQAPGVTARQPVNTPLQTGVKAVDAMTAIGRGQRQLIIGDRQTGKTAIVIDTIINQREQWGTDQEVKCIYVAIGQKASTVAEVVGALDEAGALEYTVIVNASASDPAPFQ